MLPRCGFWQTHQLACLCTAVAVDMTAELAWCCMSSIADTHCTDTKPCHVPAEPWHLAFGSSSFLNRSVAVQINWQGSVIATCALQVTKNGIVHLAFHPCTDKLILAAADKSGHIGLWSVDNDLAAPSGSASKENKGQANQAEGQHNRNSACVKGEESSGSLHCCLRLVDASCLPEVLAKLVHACYSAPQNKELL